MKIPRDLTGKTLIKLLSRFGYEATRQTGSHIRLTTHLNGKHHITIPNHDPIKIGTLSGILDDVAEHFNINKQMLLEQLF